ncbi:MAG: hypothetical protein AJITA_01320 [Acetilactobacillus jinshanensis]
MTIQDMGKNLLATQKNNQTVRIQSKNALYVGQVSGLSNGILSLKTKNGAQKFNMQDVDNYKIMK